MKKIVVLISAVCLFTHANAQKVPRTPPSHTTPSLFVENKGQWAPEARFKAELPYGAVFITDQGFVYNFVSRQDMEKVHELYEEDKGIDVSNEAIRHHAYKVNFEGANINTSGYSKQQKSNTLFNYFIGNDQSRWVGNVGLYGNIVHENIYNGIDVSISTINQSVKYDFLVATDADASQISLSFEGVKPAITSKGELQLTTSINEVIEKAPYSYQDINGKRINVPTRYQLNNDKLTFVFPEGYNKAYPLVIDPELTFATYSGGNAASNYSFATTYDSEGHLYAGAQAYGIGWPVTTGAFQSTWAGSQDVSVNKYSPDGLSLIYSTYYGGSSVDLPHAMMVNEQDELIIVGTTTSSNLPVTGGCYDNTYNNARDIFVAHFNATGSALIGATYIGSNGVAEPNTFSLTGSSTAVTGQNTTSPLELNIDDAGDIWVVTNTLSNTFPVTANALQGTSAGNMDAVLFKMDPSCTNLLYSTYLGGSGNDAGFGIKFQSDGNIVICGATQSTNFPTTAGVFHPTALGGTFDAFVSVISPGGVLLSSTYLGTGSVDQAVNLDIDCADNIYILGRTDGNYPVSAGVYAMANSDMFIDKLTANLSSSLLSTRVGYNIGGNTKCFPTGFVLDICGNVYISTLTHSGSSTYVVPGMPLTPDAFSTTPDNFYFIALEAGFNDLLFATYFGLPNVDDHTHVGVNRMDKNGIVYHSICCAGTGWPTSPANVYAPNKQNSSGQDIISFKFNFDAINIDLVAESSQGGMDTATHCIRGCKSSFITFERAGELDSALTIHYIISGDATNGVDYQLIADSIVIPANQPTAELEIKPLLIPNPSGVKEVVIQALSPCGCEDGSSNIVREARVKIYDSLFVEIITPLDTICPHTQITIEANIDSTLEYHWLPAAFDQGSLIIHPIPTQTSQYKITATQPGAPATCPPRTIIYTATVEPIPLISFDKKETTVCLMPGDSLDINAYIQPGGINYQYQWAPEDYLRNTTDLNNKFHAPIGDYVKVLSVSTPAAHCSNMDSILIHVAPPFSFTGIYPANDTTIRYGDEVQLDVMGEAAYWIWSPVSYPADPFAKNPVVQPLETTLFTVIGFDEYGCRDTASVLVNVVFGSNAGVANAFSPNGDGLNDVFKIENRRFEKMTVFKIFNRNGQCVYDGKDPEKGWDGTFKGMPCDIGTYYYLIKLIYPDATEKQFKGDLTLIR
jgi:gliding motility-associated-like protein